MKVITLNIKGVPTTFNEEIHERKIFNTFEDAENYRNSILNDWFQVVISPDYGKKKKVLLGCHYKRIV